jgi:hypothetical protein
MTEQFNSLEEEIMKNSWQGLPNNYDDPQEVVDFYEEMSLEEIV